MFKQKSIVLILIALFITTSLVGTVGFSQNDADLEKIDFRLNWIPQGNHAVYYVAKDKGWYEDVGLKVNIQRGSGSGDAVKYADVGRVDIAMADASTVAVSRAQGANVKIIAEVYVTSPFTVWARKDKGITEPEDLAGHTIGAPAGDAQRVFFPAFASAVGIGTDDVTWVNIGPGAKIQSLGAGSIDATVHYSDQLYLYKEAVGDNLVRFRWPEYGVNPYGKSLIANEKTIKEKPEILKKFLEASFRAYRWTIKNPGQAIEIERKYAPEADKEKFLAMLNESIKLMKNESVLVHGLGWIDNDQMERTVELVNKHFGIDRKLTAEEMYTRQFLPHYTWPYPSEG